MLKKEKSHTPNILLMGTDCPLLADKDFFTFLSNLWLLLSTKSTKMLDFFYNISFLPDSGSPVTIYIYLFCRKLIS